jgi:hypothetical protein
MRHLTHCEHGTLHLRWRRSTVQLTPLEFNSLAQFLAKWRENESTAATSDNCASLFRDSSGMIQLWVVGVGLYLTRDDLLLLIELIDEVAQQPNALSFRPSGAGQLAHAGPYRQLRVAPDGVCFAN